MTYKLTPEEQRQMAALRRYAAELGYDDALHLFMVSGRPTLERAVMWAVRRMAEKSGVPVRPCPCGGCDESDPPVIMLRRVG